MDKVHKARDSKCHVQNRQNPLDSKPINAYRHYRNAKLTHEDSAGLLLRETHIRRHALTYSYTPEQELQVRSTHV
jgi:hypothetical protein